MLAGVEDVSVGLEYAVAEIGLSQILPDVFGWIELRAGRRQWHEGDIGRWPELTRRVPSSLVEDQQRMCAGSNATANRVEVGLHGLGVGLRHDEGDAGVAARTDGAEHIGVLVALILGLARPRSLSGPLIDEAVLLTDPHLVLEPDLDRRFWGELGHDRRDLRGKVFLNAAIASGS